ncbi:hypothetical protein H6G80_25045 [Nostoc sp. FACHB-87]|nr:MULTISPECIES: hypothetical protein [Nostocaceae]MBD2457330.1 hypothetical protein [Nostoc sp. FACHB-87]MBD2478399.1 hypothetical protein [Anabaena sp. FACHB-83]
MCAEPSGRIYSRNDRTWRVGRKICLGEKIEPNGSPVRVLCYLNRQFITIERSTRFDKEICDHPAKESMQCSVVNVLLCPRNFKGPEDEPNSPALISPYGNSIINNKPDISWRAVADADSYTVVLKGNKVDWEVQVKTNTTVIPYPKEQKELLYGNAYNITIIANRGSKRLSFSSSVVSLLPLNKVQDISAKVQQVKVLGLPPDEEAALDLDTVFMSEFLLDETIKELKTRIIAGSQDPTIFRVLGDRYVGALLLEQAQQSYTKAEQLAKKNGNEVELKKIELGFKTLQQLRER